MPDLIFTHARVRTLDGQFSEGEALAVQDGRIVAVGTSGDVLNLQRPGTRVVSLDGATVLPGFNDAHCHLLHFGFALDMVPLAAPEVQSVGDIVRSLTARAASAAAPGGFIRGRGYDQNRLAERRHPSRHELDAVPGNPCVLLTHASGHAMAVNSRVLREAGITRDTPDPPGGTIVRDERGEPTGVLLENAMGLAQKVTPAPTHMDKVAALGRASRALHQMGVTSASDASTGLSDIPAYRDAAGQGLLTTRCTLMVLIRQLSQADGCFTTPEELAETGDGPWVRIGPAKLFSDGAITTRTALLRAPYADSPEQLGTAMWPSEQLDDMVLRAHRAGWQIAAHAIGDGAIDRCLDALGKAQSRHPRPDCRHRVEHAMLLWPDQIGRMARLGVLPVFQPEFIARFGDAYVTALGRARAERIMPYAATRAAGLPLVFSSDLPVVPGHPLDGVAAALRRRTPGGELLNAALAVDVRAALRAYTYGGAYSTFAESDRGTIAPGQRADLVVLSGDPTVLPPDEWEDAVHVSATLVGGRVVSGQI